MPAKPNSATASAKPKASTNVNQWALPKKKRRTKAEVEATIDGNIKRVLAHRRTSYTQERGHALCRLIASGYSAPEACAELRLEERTFYDWMLDNPEFAADYERARDIRAGAAFTEQQLQIADNTSTDWSYNPESGKLTVNKEAMLRSKLRIETRQWQQQRRHPLEWGDRQQIDLKSDIASLSPEERMRKAEEMLEMIAYIKAGGPPKPPPLVYDPSEGDSEPEMEIGRRSRSAR